MVHSILSMIPNRWNLRCGALDFAQVPHVMGILNVTPDSFSDGGAHESAEAGLRRAGEMISEGASIIDVGAESTRPGSAPVSAEEQIARIEAVIPAIRKRHPAIPVSIDTQSAAVASAAIELGVDIINDVSALSDPEMATLAARTQTPIILMHMRETPATMQTGLAEETYTDVVSEIIEYLTVRIAVATSAGISADRIAIDPGLGFGKTVEQNLTILRRAGEFVAMNHPVLIGASRKSFIGAVLDQPTPTDRLAGSLACALAAALAGVHIIRAHDVKQTVDTLRLAMGASDLR